MIGVIEVGNMLNSEVTPRREIQKPLMFYIPDNVRARAELISKVEASMDEFLLEEILVEETKPAKEETKIYLDLTTDEHAPLFKKIEKEVKEEITRPEREIIPFFSLELEDPAAVYNVGTSFLKDIAEGKKHFGFCMMADAINDLHLLVYGSFINYSSKKSVLIVVRDINDKSFDKFRMNFTNGSLWKWKTCEWGNVCLVDYKQISGYAEEFKYLDLDFLTEEFSAVLWALPAGNKKNAPEEDSLNVLSKINSVTFVVGRGRTKSKDLEKMAKRYECFNIPAKGILIGEEAE